MVYEDDKTSFSSVGGEDELSIKNLEEMINVATQRAKFMEQTNELLDTCFDICVEKPGNKLDNKTSTCLVNCVNRFIDTSAFITTRYVSKLERSANRM